MMFALRNTALLFLGKKMSVENLRIKNSVENFEDIGLMFAVWCAQSLDSSLVYLSLTHTLPHSLPPSPSPSPSPSLSLHTRVCSAVYCVVTGERRLLDGQHESLCACGMIDGVVIVFQLPSLVEIARFETEGSHSVMALAFYLECPQPALASAEAGHADVC